jgi:hypothetical protein
MIVSMTLPPRPLVATPGNRRCITPFLTFVDVMNPRVLSLVLAHMPQFEILYWSRDQVSLTVAREDIPRLNALRDAILPLPGKREGSCLSRCGAMLSESVVWDNVEHLTRTGYLILKTRPMVDAFRIDLSEGVMSLDSYARSDADAGRYARVL